jgi:amidase
MTTTPTAFVPHTQVARASRAQGPLAGLTFAAKDVFAVRGHRNTAGHPAWEHSHEPALHDAQVVSQLLEAGAGLVGVTILDELAYSLAGQNMHYGTPVNPRARQRLCGGSSCGSAAAVAACLCDFAIGTDTGGSIRVPASFCGLFGLRPSHGRLSLEGVVPLAPSFDTAGFMARDAETFARVASVLLGPAQNTRPALLLFAEDAFAACAPEVRTLLFSALTRAARALEVPLEPVTISPAGFTPMRTAFRRLQAREVWATHGAWVTAEAPAFSPAVAERFAMARTLFESGEGDAQDSAIRATLRENLDALLTPHVLLCMPAAPGIAPRVDETGRALDVFRTATLELTSLASLTGVPQLVVPAREYQDAPLGLSFISERGSDAWLAALAGLLADSLAPEASRP